MARYREISPLPMRVSFSAPQSKHQVMESKSSTWASKTLVLSNGLLGCLDLQNLESQHSAAYVQS